jgi:hypothetical protein
MIQRMHSKLRPTHLQCIPQRALTPSLLLLHLCHTQLCQAGRQARLVLLLLRQTVQQSL